MKYEWGAITSLAYLTLIELDLHAFPIPPNKIKCKGAKITSYQRYAQKTGLSVEDVACDHELDDAFVLKGLRQGITLILYNKEKPNSRIKHTLWHEVGHVKCDHQKHSAREEIEAHFFASQANAPNVLIKAIAQRGYKIDVPFLMECFELSEESANKKMDYLKKYHFDHSNDFDDIVLTQFLGFINLRYPIKTKHYEDNYYENLERDREKWY